MIKELLDLVYKISKDVLANGENTKLANATLLAEIGDQLSTAAYLLTTKNEYVGTEVHKSIGIYIKKLPEKLEGVLQEDEINIILEALDSCMMNIDHVEDSEINIELLGRERRIRKGNEEFKGMFASKLQEAAGILKATSKLLKT